MGANQLKNNEIIFKNIFGNTRANQFGIVSKGVKYDSDQQL